MEQHAIVFIEIGGVPVPAGRLTIVEDGRSSRSEFTYGRRYLERRDAVALDPVQLPLVDETAVTEPDFLLFNGIRDAAPDAWGRGLIDAYMMRTRGRVASEAEYLLGPTGETRVGALQFGRGPERPSRVLDFELPDMESDLGSLESFLAMVDQFFEGQHVPEAIATHVAPGSDFGGARPKGTIKVDGFPWLAKFGIRSDRVNMAGVEAGCLDLCEMAGLEVCQRRIIKVNGRDVLLLKRFDRVPGEGSSLYRVHMISGLTLLGRHEMDRGISGYADLYDAMRRHSRLDTALDIYKRMVMNVLCGNIDDHYRNHAFLLDGNGTYKPSPVYDVTPSLQVLGSRRTFLHLGKAGSGREALLENAIAAGPSLGMPMDRAIRITNECSSMVAASWRDVMSRRGVSRRDIEMIEQSFSEAGKIFDLGQDGPEAGS